MPQVCTHCGFHRVRKAVVMSLQDKEFLQNFQMELRIHCLKAGVLVLKLTCHAKSIIFSAFRCVVMFFYCEKSSGVEVCFIHAALSANSINFYRLFLLVMQFLSKWKGGMVELNQCYVYKFLPHLYKMRVWGASLIKKKDRI